MQIDVFTLFPHWFDWFRTQRHVTNAAALGHTVETVDLRETTPMKNDRVDDVPFGGGAGMVLRVDVVEAALRARYGVDPVELREQRRVIAMTPGGRLLDDHLADTLGGRIRHHSAVRRYRGLRRRVIDHFCTEEHLRSAATCWPAGSCRDGRGDTVLRKLPGSLGHADSATEESFSSALEGGPEYPHYTRPADWRGWACPTCCSPGTTSRSANGRLEQSRRRAGGPLP